MRMGSKLSQGLPQNCGRAKQRFAMERRSRVGDRRDSLTDSVQPRQGGAWRKAPTRPKRGRRSWRFGAPRQTRAIDSSFILRRLSGNNAGRRRLGRSSTVLTATCWKVTIAAANPNTKGVRQPISIVVLSFVKARPGTLSSSWAFDRHFAFPSRTVGPSPSSSTSESLRYGNTISDTA
jgi:hypothetical protein